MASAQGKKAAKKLQDFLKDKTPSAKRFKSLVGYCGMDLDNCIEVHSH